MTVEDESGRTRKSMEAAVSYRRLSDAFFTLSGTEVNDLTPVQEETSMHGTPKVNRPWTAKRGWNEDETDGSVKGSIRKHGAVTKT